MQKLQEDAGLIKKRSERLDWMYAGPSHMNQDLQEDYLLGKKSVSSLIETAPSISDLSAASGSLFMKNIEDGAGASMSERDMEAKIREDPLFAIKKREQEMLNRIMANPARAKKMVAPSNSSSRNNREHRELESDRNDREYGRRDSRREGRDGDSRDSRDSRYTHRDDRDGRDTRRDVYRDSHRDGRDFHRDTHRDSHRDTRRDNYHRDASHRDTHHRDSHHRDHSRYRRDRSHSPVNTSTSRVRGMSKEEREAKLAEMMQAAQDTDQQRGKRIQMYKKEDELEASMSANRAKNHDNDEDDDNDNDDGFLGYKVLAIHMILKLIFYN